MSVLLSLFNIAATSSSYWVKYLDIDTKEPHFAGLWRSCQVDQDEENGGWPCGWRSGIVHHSLSFWSLSVRVFLAAGTLLNCAVVVFYLAAFVCKMNKKSKRAIRLMEWANLMLVVAFCVLLCGFGLFISNSSNFSVWLWILSLVFVVITSNLLTRQFAALYFQNTRALRMSSKTSSSCCPEGGSCSNPEEKIALASINNTTSNDVVATTEGGTTVRQETSDAVTNTEKQEKQQAATQTKDVAAAVVVVTKNEVKQKSSEEEEVSGSNEALIPASAPPAATAATPETAIETATAAAAAAAKTEET